MITYQLTSTAIGIVLAAAILYLVRKDHLHGPYAYWWLTVAVVAVIVGIFPGLIDRIATETGVTYPPTLAIVLAIALILVKMLTMDIERSRNERKVRRLTQRLAMLEEENRELREDLDSQSPTG